MALGVARKFGHTKSVTEPIEVAIALIHSSLRASQA
jgi:hypothetical protein